MLPEAKDRGESPQQERPQHWHNAEKFRAELAKMLGEEYQGKIEFDLENNTDEYVRVNRQNYKMNLEFGSKGEKNESKKSLEKAEVEAKKYTRIMLITFSDSTGLLDEIALKAKNIGKKYQGVGVDDTGNGVGKRMFEFFEAVTGHKSEHEDLPIYERWLGFNFR